MRRDGRGRRRIHRWWIRRPSCDREADTARATSSLPSTSPECLADHVARDESHVRRPLCQATHEIRIPLRAEGHIDTHSISVAHELLLQVAADAVEHLKLES